MPEAGDPAVGADADRVIAWHCHAVIEDASRDVLSRPGRGAGPVQLWDAPASQRRRWGGCVFAASVAGRKPGSNTLGRAAGAELRRCWQRRAAADYRQGPGCARCALSVTSLTAVTP